MKRKLSAIGEVFRLMCIIFITILLGVLRHALNSSILNSFVNMWAVLIIIYGIAMFIILLSDGYE